MKIYIDFLAFQTFICIVLIRSASAKCESSLSPLLGFNKLEHFSGSSRSSHEELTVTVSRNKRAAKPFTQFFDELLGQRLFNTTMNFIVPGAKVHLPRHTEEGSVDHLAMQAFFGIFWAAAWLAMIAIPVSKTYFHPFGIGRSLDEDNNGLNFKWKLNERVAAAIGLDWKSCAQKSICQAHEFPEKYGVLGKTVQLIFPADDDNFDDNSLFQTRPFHGAAVNGAIGHDCSHIYKCFFDILDVILYVKDYCSATLTD